MPILAWILTGVIILEVIWIVCLLCMWKRDSDESRKKYEKERR